MLSKFEFIGIGLSVIFMAMALYLVRLETSVLTLGEQGSQMAQLPRAGVVVVGAGENVTSERTNALLGATDNRGNLKKLVIDDIKIGTGTEVGIGSKVSVHYIGTLPNGQEFDNSNKRGTPFSFTVGEGKVIKGWEEGLLGMKVGGQRILVIPPELAYGDSGIGPIPPKATLVFAIDLIAVE
ncbi:MAG TPA: FKBP-type peptidyl-prolyl cis-trans isomerase [Candidatus Paceibacterota bacterium]|nr:FKBP-type peptidyl-prolyl cis-trans isomerase [Candidatus Paceibacterota bacterium]HMO83249.1 FKBP-type peptidyl-prolyl cis-trans isomerase [Candidatus Paceibacterota bacterium]